PTNTSTIFFLFTAPPTPATYTLSLHDALPMISLAGPIALLFPGQGVQKPGMGKSLHDRYPAARRAFERAEEVLELPVRRLCFEGPIEELNRTEIIQPCVMTVCWAAYEVWRESYGFENVQVTAGHSLGEIAAL